MRTKATRLVFLLILLMVADITNAQTIPLEQDHGIYLVPVRINDTITLPFVIDSGASEVAIPSDVFLTLTRSGSIGASDALGTGIYKLADGSTQKSECFLLREVRIGNRVIKDVVANVAPVSGDPLLGQSFLSKLALWILDNSRHAPITCGSGPTGRAITAGH
jgi:predicted aspartyl protease